MHWLASYRWMLAISLMLATTAAIVVADSGDAPAPAASDSSGSFTTEREAAALTFVRQHHPELAELLINLRETDHREYERAISELFRASERLATTRERNPQRYELDLRAWQVQSQIQLVLAQLAMSPDAGLEGRLRKLLAAQFELRSEIQQLELRRLRDRLRQMQDEIDRIARDRDELVEQQMVQLMRKVGRKPVSSPPASSASAGSAAASRDGS